MNPKLVAIWSWLGPRHRRRSGLSRNHSSAIKLGISTWQAIRTFVKEARCWHDQSDITVCITSMRKKEPMKLIFRTLRYFLQDINLYASDQGHRKHGCIFATRLENPCPWAFRKNIWSIINTVASFGAKIYSDVRPWTLSVSHTWSSQKTYFSENHSLLAWKAFVYHINGFRIFHIKKKYLHGSIYHAKFQKDSLKTPQNLGSQTCQFVGFRFLSVVYWHAFLCKN